MDPMGELGNIQQLMRERYLLHPVGCTKAFHIQKYKRNIFSIPGFWTSVRWKIGLWEKKKRRAGRRLWDFREFLTEFNTFYWLLFHPESCLLIVRCLVLVRSQVIGTLCPTVTGGQIGEKSRGKGQWSNPLDLFNIWQLQVNQTTLGPAQGQGTARRH